MAMDFVDFEVREAVALRRYLHANPEPGFEEFETQARLWSIFEALGAVEATAAAAAGAMTLRKCAGTGIVLDIPGTGAAEVGTASRAANVEYHSFVVVGKERRQRESDRSPRGH
jgi:metal-dependent amidase/aminoacylase/carboxypeptidase family protein